MRNPLETRTKHADSRLAAVPTSLSVCLSHNSPTQLLADPGAGVLGVISFGQDSVLPVDPRHVRVPLPSLAGMPAVEVWTTSLPVECGTVDGISFAENGEVILAQLNIRENAAGGFEAEAYAAYVRIRRFLEGKGYPCPVRIWNYFSGINQGEDDAERYKQFCIGRARAIHDSPDYEQRLPAASAIGSAEPGLVIYLIAARQTGIQVENPRQVSAFHYPRQYGPMSPSFSRARLMRWTNEHHLYLSGTSSVVGHETLHENDCRAQLKETIRNIDILLGQAAEAVPGVKLGWEQLRIMRVYLRYPEHLELAQEGVRSLLGADAPVVFLHGDICRRDLQLEIEGVYSAPDPG